MRTEFTQEQLADADVARSNKVIRKCVHCGFCTATCPTYLLLGDELDSPRGRIYLIKNMLEKGGTPDAATVRHLDRCLSCLSCMTTCPSGVHYMHLIDHARAHIGAHFRRPLIDRMIRAMIGLILPRRRAFRLALRSAALARPMASVMARVPALQPVAAMLRLAPARLPAPVTAPPALTGPARGRVALLRGCAEPVLRPGIRAAAMRLMARMQLDIVDVPGEGCCGAIEHHLGKVEAAARAARRNAAAWARLGPFDAIVTTAAGCGTMLKDYAHVATGDADADAAAGLARDLMEIVERYGLPPVVRRTGLVMAYQSACSLQHGQRIRDLPVRLLERCGFDVRIPAEPHLCCGSAGTYNILQPQIAGQLRDRKAAALIDTGAELVVTGNIGCLTQLAPALPMPVVHIAELLDWATGGPAPVALLEPDNQTR